MKIPLLRYAITGVVVFAIGGTIVGLHSGNRWHPIASPGNLSQAHAFLATDCQACHTPISGVKAVNCIVCHANDVGLLQREPTAFHANIQSCKECHQEHHGVHSRPVQMNHIALARIGIRELETNPDPESEDALIRQDIRHWLANEYAETKPVQADTRGHPPLTAVESMLNCASCHRNDDRHFRYFGMNCAQCHGTAAWSIASFQHPSTSSMDCAQCHQAPPSHYMGHFKMISQRVAGKPHANVNECYSCHQTTSWPDIRNVGWYKHH